MADGSDTCLAPVLAMHEVTDDPHNRARDTFVEVGGVLQPAPAPRFATTPAAVPSPPPWPGQYGREALESWGFEETEITALCEHGALRLC